MKKFLLEASLIVLILTINLYFPKTALATQLNWRLVYPSTDESTTIKIDQSDNQTVYASIRKHSSGFELLKSSNLGLDWVSTKNNLTIGSDVNWISIYDQDDSKVAISLWEAGIYFSENYGLTWQLIYPSLTPRSVEISPNNVNTIFVGIGGNHDSNSGVYKSINKGINWTKLILLTNNNAEIVIDKNNSNRIFADSDPFFYRSQNAGTNWTRLPLSKAYAISVIDNQDSNIIYSAQFDSNTGIFKSINNGDSWALKSEGIGTPYFRLSQDNDGSLYASRINSGGGVWRSTDRAEHWENVGDPAWGTANTWGLDAKNGRVIVSVEGLGIFIANADGSPIEQNPIVFVPGMTASWSQKGLIDNEPTTYSDWQLIPGSDFFYKPIFDTLSGAGLVINQSMFTFGYDWTSQISQSAASLNTFLENEVLPKNGGQKANIVSHSMGGLVTAYCFEKIAGCSDKINKIVSAGSPFQGAVDTYPLWEGGKIEETNAVKKLLFRVLLDRRSSPEFATNVSLIHARAKGIGDIMPIFNYINGKPYNMMSAIGHNSALESLVNPSAAFKNAMTVLWGNEKPTSRTINTSIPDRWEQLNGLWPDGKPVSKTFANGDNSVLDFSANLSGASDSQSFGTVHTEYFRDTAVLGKMLAAFNLTGTPVVAPSSPIDSVLLFFLHSPATLVVKNSHGDIVGESDSTGKAVFVWNPQNDVYKTEITGTGNGNFGVEAIFANENSDPQIQEIDSTISTGQTKNYYFNFTGNAGSSFINGSTDFLQSLKIHASRSGNKKAVSLSNRVEKLLLALKISPLKLPVILAIRLEYFNLIDILRLEKSPDARFFLLPAGDDLFNLLVDLDKQYGPDPVNKQSDTQLKLAQNAVGKFEQKKKFSSLDLSNLQLALEDLAKSQDYFSSQNPYQSFLLSSAVLILTK